MTNYDETENLWIDKGWVLEWTPPKPPIPPNTGTGVTIATQLYREAIIYNTSKVKPADAPKAHADLFDPKWKGTLVSTRLGAR